MEVKITHYGKYVGSLFGNVTIKSSGMDICLTSRGLSEELEPILKKHMFQNRNFRKSHLKSK